jgi:ribulose 1,5-bisphosphate carboxylase large subunit-like protein
VTTVPATDADVEVIEVAGVLVVSVAAVGLAALGQSAPSFGEDSDVVLVVTRVAAGLVFRSSLFGISYSLLEVFP